MKKLVFSPHPILETQRLKLAQFGMEDDKEIFIIRSDKRIQKHIDRPLAITIEDARKFIDRIIKGIKDNNWLYWGITLKNNTKVVGTICLWNFSAENNSSEVGYELMPDFQGKGLAQEALVKVLDYGFNKLSLDFISAFVKPENESSVKLLEKNSFKYSGAKDSTHIYILKRNLFNPSVR